MDVEKTATDLMLDFFRDPINLKVLFLLNDTQPMDFSSMEIRDLFKKRGDNIGEKHIRTCISQLKTYDVIRTSRKVGGMKMYVINSESELVQKILELGQSFDNVYSIVFNLPPKPSFVSPKYYGDNSPKHWGRDRLANRSQEQ